MENITLNYYNENAESFTRSTIDVNFHETQDRFLAKLAKGSCILDFGCGSGRDSKYFLEKGYEVEATDGSVELCHIASEHAGIPVKQMMFEELNEVDRYHGIWACSSILHVKKEELPDILGKIARALKADGVLYTSFKYGDFEGMRNGRYFTNLTEESFGKLLEEITELTLEEFWITGDVRPGREEEKWLNVLVRKGIIEKE